MAKLPADYRPPHEPRLLADKLDREILLKKVKDGINCGLTASEAFVAAGGSKHTFKDWLRFYREDVEDGYTGTNLIMFIDELARADIQLHKRLLKAMWKKADEGDTRILMYLEDNRFGAANKRKNTLELDAKDDKAIEINIVNMTGVDADNNEEEAIEVDYEVNDGSSRDDSNSTEMD
jgi:hypothetical protein